MITSEEDIMKDEEFWECSFIYAILKNSEKVLKEQ